MENRKDLISEIRSVIRRLTERNYMLGMQRHSEWRCKPPIDIPSLPKNGEMIKFMIAVCEILTLAYKAGRNQESYKLAFSDTYITKKRLIEQSAIGGDCNE